jgi:hypothetical protein
MKFSPSALILLTITLIVPQAYAEQPSEFCEILKSFVEVVKPNETKELVFNTSWGANFKDAPEPLLFAKRCEHNDDPTAKKVCGYLMKHASVEFTSVAVKKAISCLSPNSNFDAQLTIKSGSFSVNYGTQERGSIVDITFSEDSKVGGMVFKLAVYGY